MGAWLDGQVASAPTDDAQVLGWWGQFKRKCTAKVASLNREAVTRRARPSANLGQLCDAAQAAASALDAAPHDAARLADAIDAQDGVSAAMRSEAGTEVLSASTGHLVRDPASVPQVIANYWHDVSALPSEAELPAAIKQQAQAATLEALWAHPLPLPAAEAQDEVHMDTAATDAAALAATPGGGHGAGGRGLGGDEAEQGHAA
ncbi:hypothetical protein TSOC_010133 [Tetrabaena socialis]|uniref:Uncharacterized protein n=1 Tax=Tetrabaena socialis TaxID=47790 RepID=A0A2J7ZU26_9CHLO|nr:hypothetical protein TSOC_010133 [Tetrabaena socialis]|eukprot:PNH03777.1 hypothetical protein TSOC_010133 [Tetrabaena socialis]